MFANLYFCMVNSMGVKASVRLSENEGLVEYGIDFPDSNEGKTQHGCLGRRGSERFLHRLGRKGIVDILFKFNDFGLREQGEHWSLSILGDDDRKLSLSGPEDSFPVLNAVIQDLAEILDDQFCVTRYIDPQRLDNLEIGFVFNEVSPELLECLKDYPRCDHTETISLNRETRCFHFTRLFPSSCYRLGIECVCEDEVRGFLDQTGEIFKEDHLFEDVHDDSDAPKMVFTFSYHDGTVKSVKRNLSLVGLRDMEYVDMVDFLFEVLLQVFFRQGIFDKRYMLPREMLENSPFFVSYKEGEREGQAE
jgi:hypothetical protein